MNLTTSGRDYLCVYASAFILRRTEIGGVSKNRIMFDNTLYNIGQPTSGPLILWMTKENIFTFPGRYLK